MAISYSISGPKTGAITVPYHASWATPEWTWTFWLKVGASILAPGTFATSLSGGATFSGVSIELYFGDLYVTVQSEQRYGDMGAGTGWHHVAFAYDATDFRVYIDGTLTHTHGPFGTMRWTTDVLTIAAFDNVTCRMKDARLYTAKLSAGNIATLATGAEYATNLLANWRMNEGSGTTITDIVSGYVGTGSSIDWSTDIPVQNPGVPSGFAAGTLMFVPGPLVVTATEAIGGTAPITHQWQRSTDGGSFSNLANGGGVSGATTLTVTDGSAVAGHLYRYRCVYTDAVAAVVTSVDSAAEVYTGGDITSSGGAVPLIGRSPFIQGVN